MLRRFWGQAVTAVLGGLLTAGCPGDIDDPYYPAYINVDQQLRIEFSDRIALIAVTGPTQVTETVAVGKLINKTDSKFAADVTGTLPPYSTYGGESISGRWEDQGTWADIGCRDCVYGTVRMRKYRLWLTYFSKPTAEVPFTPVIEKLGE